MTVILLAAILAVQAIHLYVVLRPSLVAARNRRRARALARETAGGRRAFIPARTVRRVKRWITRTVK